MGNLYAKAAASAAVSKTKSSEAAKELQEHEVVTERLRKDMESAQAKLDQQRKNMAQMLEMQKLAREKEKQEREAAAMGAQDEGDDAANVVAGGSSEGKAKPKEQEKGAKPDEESEVVMLEY